MAADFPMTPLDEKPETPSEREERIRMEAEVIAQARAEVAAGLYIDGDDLFAWFDALEQDENAPFPEPRTPPTFVQP